MTDASGAPASPASVSTQFKRNNRGRPKGSKNRRTVWLNEISLKDAAEVVAAVIAKAKAGDMKAAGLFLDRVWPAPRGRQIPVSLPPVEGIDGVTAAFTTTAQALSRGTIDPSEAVQIGQLLEGHRRAIETTTLESRMRRLEQERAQRP